MSVLNIDLSTVVSKHFFYRQTGVKKYLNQDGYEFDLWTDPWDDRSSEMEQIISNGFSPSQNTVKFSWFT